MKESEQLQGDPGDRTARKLYDFQKRFEDYKGRVVRTRNLYCQCGYALRVKEVWDGTERERTFFDSDKDVRLHVCPGCKSELAGVQLHSSVPKGASPV
jgi:hypothetical protein